MAVLARLSVAGPTRAGPGLTRWSGQPCCAPCRPRSVHPRSRHPGPGKYKTRPASSGGQLRVQVAGRRPAHAPAARLLLQRGVAWVTVASDPERAKHLPIVPPTAGHHRVPPIPLGAALKHSPVRRLKILGRATGWASRPRHDQHGDSGGGGKNPCSGEHQAGDGQDAAAGTGAGDPGEGYWPEDQGERGSRQTPVIRAATAKPISSRRWPWHRRARPGPRVSEPGGPSPSTADWSI